VAAAAAGGRGVRSWARKLHPPLPAAARALTRTAASMMPTDFPAPHDGFVITHFLVVSDQDRSRDFYQTVFGASVVLERDPVVLKLANSWIILNVGGGPTDDKPTVTLSTPPDPDQASAFINLRVADIAAAYRDWSARGAEFLTEPKDHGREIRAYIRDPDGHLIEVGQAAGGYAGERP
jgi:lactoylglutathione lyase